jgi:SPP1 gp7 family putative phage head morphogenesis protein
MLSELLESIKKPGIESLVGRALERRCRVDLEEYFKKLGTEVLDLQLEKLVESPSLEIARHTAEMRLHNPLRRRSTDLLQILALNIQRAFDLGYKLAQVKEADEEVTPTADYIDKIGQTGEDAAAYAAETAAKLVTGINDTTRQMIADAVATGIEQRLGVPKTGRLIRQTVTDMTRKRAETIASTEMNDAFSEATLRKLGNLGIAYKQWIVSLDPCPECLENEGQVIPMSELFSSGDLRPPVHPNCRCAVVGARAPSE